MSIAAEGEPGPESSRSCTRRSSSRSAIAISTTCSRSPTPSSSATCPRCCGLRTATTRSSTSCSGWRRRCCSTPSTSPTRGRASSAPAPLSEEAYVVDLAWLRSTPGASASRRPSTRRGCAPNCWRSRASPSATIPPRRSPRCSSSAGWPRAWAGRRLRSQPAKDALVGARPRRPAERSRAAPRGGPRAAGARSRGPHADRRRSDTSCASTAAAGACTPTTATRAARSASGRSPEPPAARRASSARASARRSCATPPTCRRCKAAQGLLAVTRLTTCADPEAVAQRAARDIAGQLQRICAERAVAHLALSGGTHADAHL